MIGAAVVDDDGHEIGEVEERFVVVRLDELQRAEGDDSEELTLNRTAIDDDDFMGEPSFEKADGRWEPSPL